MYSISSSTLSAESSRRQPKKWTKSKCVCFNDVLLLVTMKIRLKIKIRSQRDDIIDPGLDIDANILNM